MVPLAFYYVLNSLLYGYNFRNLSVNKELEIIGITEGYFGFLKDDSDSQWRAFS